MKFYISRVFRNEVLLLNEFLINDADVLSLFYFIKFIIFGRDVTGITKINMFFSIFYTNVGGRIISICTYVPGSTRVYNLLVHIGH